MIKQPAHVGGEKMKIHIVQKGDTFYKIAKKYGVDVEQLKSMNTQIPNMEMLLPGMKVKIPTVKVPVQKEMVVKEVKKEKVMEDVKLDLPKLPKQPMPQGVPHPYLSMNLFQMQPYVYYQPHLMMPQKEYLVPIEPIPATTPSFTPPELPSLPSIEEEFCEEHEEWEDEETKEVQLPYQPMPQMAIPQQPVPPHQPIMPVPYPGPMMPYHHGYYDCMPPWPVHHEPCGCKPHHPHHPHHPHVMYPFIQPQMPYQSVPQGAQVPPYQMQFSTPQQPPLFREEEEESEDE